MRILGIDPGIAITGYGIIEDGHRPEVVTYGDVRTPAKTPAPARLHHIFRELQNVIRETTPDVVAVEQLFFNRNTQSAMAVGQARGVVLLAAAEAGLDVHEYTPLEVKMAVTGQGRATKDQVGFMVRAILRLDDVPRPDDVADALAVALTCAQTVTTRQRWQGAAR